MLKFHNKNETPPGMFRFYVAETKTWIEHVAWNDLVVKVKLHYQANNIPIGLQFEEWIEDQACKNTDPRCCMEQGTGVPVLPRESRSLAEIIRGTRTILEWWIKEDKRTVSKEVAESRAATCVRCAYNMSVKNCPSCSRKSIDDAIVFFTNPTPTKHDNQLEGCWVCGCALKLKVHFPYDILARNEPTHVRDAYPEWCWMNPSKNPPL